MALATTLMACDGDGGGGSAKAGETSFDLTITGDSLHGPVHIKTVSDVPSYTYFDHGFVGLMGMKIQEPPADGSEYIQNMTFSYDDGMNAPGDYDFGDSEMDIVIWGIGTYEGKPTSLSLRPHDGQKVNISSVGKDGITIEIDADFSPTQMGSKDLVFHMKGKIKAKKWMESYH